MNIVLESHETDQIVTLEQRRAHLNMSLAERRRQLAEQAEKLAKYYEETEGEREEWQGGDIIEH